MKFSISARDFSEISQNAIQFRGRGVETHPAYSLVLIEANKSLVRLSMGNATLGVRIKHKAEVHDPGKICMGVTYFDRLIGSLPVNKGQMTFEVNGSNVLVKVGRTKLKLPTQRADQFLRMPEAPKDWQKVRSKNFHFAFRKCLWATSRDTSKIAFCGLHMTHEKCEATNGHVLARCPPVMSSPHDIILPEENLTKIRQVIGPDEELNVAVQRFFWIKTKDKLIFSNIQDAKFPSAADQLIFRTDEEGFYKILNRKVRLHTAMVNRAQLIEIAGRIQSASVSDIHKSAGANVKFSHEDGELHVKSQYNIGDLSQSIVVDEVMSWSDQSFEDDETFNELGVYSAGYVKSALSCLTSNVVKMIWADKKEGLSLQFHDEEIETISLVMPRTEK